MAMYEYECAKCGEQFTVKQSFADHDRKKKLKCPKCNSTKAQQLISSVHVQTGKKS